MSLKLQVLFKISICIWLVVIPTSMVSQTHPIQPTKVPTEPSDSITIHRIYADEQQNLVNIQCSFLQKAKVDSILSEHIKIQAYSKKKGEEVSHSMYVKNTEKLSENLLLISVQPSLKDAIYGVEKRDFILQFIEGDTTTEVLKTAVLSNSIQLLDLRSYTASNLSQNIRSSIFIVLAINTVLLMLIPVIRKYNFKKYHIKKYKQVTHENKAKLDPFTFESIEENDEVVVMNENVILLKSWKRLNALNPEDRAGELKSFFNETEGKGHLFKPITNIGKRITRMWFGMIGAYIVWLLYLLTMPYDFEKYRAFLSSLFDNESVQYSTTIYGDSLLAPLLGLVIGIAFITSERVYENYHSSVFKRIVRLVVGIIILIVFFVVPFFLNMYEINHNLLGNLITWMCIGTGMGIAFGTRLRIGKIMIMAFALGSIGFIIYQISMLRSILDTFNPQTVLLFNLLLLGSIAGGLSYKKAPVTKEVRHDKSPDVVDDGNPMAIQVH